MEKFLKILRIEIQDIENDLETLVKLHQTREQKGEITQYVYRVNMSQLMNEINGIRALLKSFDTLSTQNYSSCKEMIMDIDAKIKDYLKDFHYGEALYRFVKRKIDKVAYYLREEL